MFRVLGLRRLLGKRAARRLLAPFMFVPQKSLLRDEVRRQRKKVIG
jgi:hypothetical protein